MTEIPRILAAQDERNPSRILIGGRPEEWASYETYEFVSEWLRLHLEGFLNEKLDLRTINAINATIWQLLTTWEREGLLYRDWEGKWRVDRERRL